ncbi:zinc finger protein 773-like [Canis lupus familiaris]|uniref:zinc finger protein 773-like n=1 Tax=Canis lupus familiaris TaxID=9615 RepID=UPI0018F31957|nr:zinc finger protein 773-like [Canis lupus familiaris]
MAEAGAQSDAAHNLITFEDVCIYFTQEEWELLDAQKRLYCTVILENFLLVTSVGFAISPIPQPRPVREPIVSENVAIGPAEARMVQGSLCPCHKVENEDESFEHGVSIKDSQKDEEDSLASSGLVQPHVTQDEEKPCTRSQCEEAFHVGQKDCKCSECGKTFSNKDKCVQHQKIHTGEKPYKYNDCGDVFVCNSSRQEHQRVHMGSRSNDCAECGKSFIRKSHLIQHQRIHTGAKPFECSECGKAFGRKDTLTQHQKTHSGERPFMCSRCGKAFLHKDVLAEHQKSHAGEKSYKCDRCGKFFSHSSYVKVHKRIHSGTRPYVCSQCGKAYISHPHLIQHKKSHTTAKPMDEKNEENSFMTSPASVCTGDTTPEQSRMCSANVGGLMGDTPTWLGT